MLTISQIVELPQQSTSNVVDFATGQPIIFGTPAEVAEVVLMRTACLVCGRPFWWAKPVGQRGRHRRFCSSECWQIRNLQHKRTHAWRSRHGGTMDLFADEAGQ